MPLAHDRIPVLVLVHPGSACGSANFNLGKFEARAARDALIFELDHWQGGVVVIDGELSDELPSYPAFEQAIVQCLQRAAAKGLVSHRVMGGDPDQVLRAQEFVASLSEHERALVDFTVTGAWYHPEDGSGCVGSVVQALRQEGGCAEVSESAVEFSAEEPDEERCSTREDG